MNIQINNIHSTNSLSVIKVLSRIKKYDVVVIGSDIYEKGECAGSLLVDKYYRAPPITHESEYINFLNEIELNVRFAGSGIFSIIASFNYMETYLEHFVLNKPLQDMDYYMKYVCWDSIVTRYLEELIYPNISE